MNKIFSLLVLTLASTSAFAGPVLGGTVPEPEVLSLLGIGFAAIMMSRRSKK